VLSSRLGQNRNLICEQFCVDEIAGNLLDEQESKVILALARDLTGTSVPRYEIETCAKAITLKTARLLQSIGTSDAEARLVGGNNTPELQNRSRLGISSRQYLALAACITLLIAVGTWLYLPTFGKLADPEVTIAERELQRKKFPNRLDEKTGPQGASAGQLNPTDAQGDRNAQRQVRLIPIMPSGGQPPVAGGATATSRTLPAQASAQPVITAPAAISAEAASQAAFPIRVAPADAVPRNSLVRVRGLPPTAALTEGYSIEPGSWAVSLAALPELKIMLPAGTTGQSEIVVMLVSIDGTVLAETKAMLAISPADQRVATRDAGPPNATSIHQLGIGDGTERSGQPQQPVTQPRTPQDRERALRLVKKGDEQLGQGNVAAARLFYERAADAGLAQGAMALARTFDADELARLGRRDIQADPKQAQRWYERAQQLGDAEERQRWTGANARTASAANVPPSAGAEPAAPAVKAPAAAEPQELKDSPSAEADRQSVPNKAEQAVVVLVNDAPITAHEIQQRANFLAL